MAGRGTDIILGGVSDHRAKAILVEQQIDPEQAVPEARQAATDQVLREMGGEFRKALGERKDTAEDKKTLAQRFLGLMASFASDHPSVVAVRDFAPDGSPLRRYLDTVRDLPRRDKEKIAKSFYPEIENPVDFLAVHPLKASLEEIAGTREFVRIQELLDANERERVVALGGLHILAPERHEARRIDNQLRGRAGRQGDPGSSRFYLSLQDDLMRIFGSERISGLMLKLGMEEGVPIEHRLVTRSIERAQKQVESQNFSVRKHLLEYDDVMNKQRENIYALRRQILEGQIRLQDEEGQETALDTREYLIELAEDILDALIDTYAAKTADFEEWDLDALNREVTRVFGLDTGDIDFADQTSDEIRDTLWTKISESYDQKEKLVGRDVLQRVERDIMLQIVDAQWKDHLYSLDHLKEGIGLRGYGQRDPLIEYKKESFALFQAMKERVDEEIVRYLWWLRPILNEEAPVARRPAARRPPPLILNDPGAESVSVLGAARAQAPQASPFTRSQPQPQQQPPRVGGDDAIPKTVRRDEPKVGRNDPCPCGSGKKYKKCHGAAA